MVSCNVYPVSYGDSTTQDLTPTSYLGDRGSLDVSYRGYCVQKEKPRNRLTVSGVFLCVLVSLQTDFLALCVQLTYYLEVVLHLHRHSCARVYGIGHHTRTLDLNGFIQEVLHLQLYSPVVAWIKAVVDVE